MLLSLAGLPPTMGFIAEVYVITSGVGMQLVLPLAALVIGSVIGLYYYLRIVVVLLSPLPGTTSPSITLRFSRTGGATLAALVVLVIWLGVYPAPLISIVQQTTAGLASDHTSLRSVDIAQPILASSRPHGDPNDRQAVMPCQLYDNLHAEQENSVLYYAPKNCSLKKCSSPLNVQVDPPYPNLDAAE